MTSPQETKPTDSNKPTKHELIKIITSSRKITLRATGQKKTYRCNPAFRDTEFLIGDSEFQLRNSMKLCGLCYDGRGDVFGNRPFRPAGFKQPRNR